MKVTFLGAAHEVTGSCTLLEVGDKKGVIDCGMEQGTDLFENQELPVAAGVLDFVLVTHAHIDHSGLLPLLYKNGFRGAVYATAATCSLLDIMLRDCAHIQMSEAEWKSRKAMRRGEGPVEPLYDLNDVVGLMTLLRPCEYESKIQVNESVTIRFTDVGHLLGSSAIEIWLHENGEERKLTFSGDIGNKNQPILKDPQHVKDTEYLVIESTYGDRLHGVDLPDYVTELAKRIQLVLDRGGNMVIPSFAVGRTQEMLYFIREIKERGLVTGHGDFPVYVDSPLAIEATSIFLQCDTEYVDEEMQALIRSGVNPIVFPGLKVAVSQAESQAINEDKTPKVIISASGMCDAGRVRHHLKHNLWRKESMVLFVGYQAVGTLGRLLVDGLKKVKLFNEDIEVNAQIDALPSADELPGIAEKYAQAAVNARKAGFDAVEIHGAHSYLISQFLSPITNKRTDEFGGSAENRARFAKLVIEEVRKQVGPFFPIFVRISADELMEGGNTLEDTLEYLQYFEKEVDVFDVSCGLNGSIQYQIDANYLPDGWRSYMAKAVKEKYGKPCMTVGNIRDPKVAEDILARGDADFIGMGRGLIADPEWVNKVEFGNECDIRKCISCNIGCAGHRIGLNQPIRCTVNPAVNTGEDYMKQKVNKPCNVVVIGGGTAGLEAACTAAEVGCTTFLIEKKAELGGLASVISRIPDKKRLADFPNYMIHRAGRLHNLFIFKNTSATAELVKSLNPDIIVNATGSVPTLPPITGLHDLVDKDGTNVATVLKMIERINEYPKDMAGKKDAIIGGGAVGLDVMEFFTERGAEVSMVEMLPMIGNGLDPVTKCDTNAKMAKYHVKQMTNTALQEVKNDRFIVKNPEGEIEEVPFDYGFICLGMRANTPVLSEIEEAFNDTNVEIVNIGDSKRARRIIEGTEEGRNILNVLARHDYL